MVLVSVLMGSYNHERYIAEAIESILNQSFKDFELIIIDDCSADNSRKIIEDYQRKDERVRAFFHKKNLGIAKTSNECLNEANGKFISFIGSDDIWVNYKLEKQLAILKNNEDRIIWSEGEIINGDGNFTGVTFTQMHMAFKKRKNGKIFREIIDDNYIFGQSLLFKKEYCKNISFNPNLKYLSDYQFMVDLAHKYEFFFIPEPLAKYRIHGKNTISNDEKGWLKDRIILRSYFLQRYGNNISSNLKGNLYLKIGEAFSSLGKDDIAKQFYSRAIQVDFLSKEIILYLTYALTNAKSFMRHFFLLLYLKLDSFSPHMNYR